MLNYKHYNLRAINPDQPIFKPGDMVVHKTGGPKMVVCEVFRPDKGSHKMEYSCSYFESRTGPWGDVEQRLIDRMYEVELEAFPDNHVNPRAIKKG